MSGNVFEWFSICQKPALHLAGCFPLNRNEVLDDLLQRGLCQQRAILRVSSSQHSVEVTVGRHPKPQSLARKKGIANWNSLTACEKTQRIQMRVFVGFDQFSWERELLALAGLSNPLIAQSNLEPVSHIRLSWSTASGV